MGCKNGLVRWLRNFRSGSRSSSRKSPAEGRQCRVPQFYNVYTISYLFRLATQTKAPSRSLLCDTKRMAVGCFRLDIRLAFLVMTPYPLTLGISGSRSSSRKSPAEGRQCRVPQFYNVYTISYLFRLATQTKAPSRSLLCDTKRMAVGCFRLDIRLAFLVMTPYPLTLGISFSSTHFESGILWMHTPRTSVESLWS